MTLVFQQSWTTCLAGAALLAQFFLPVEASALPVCETETGTAHSLSDQRIRLHTSGPRSDRAVLVISRKEDPILPLLPDYLNQDHYMITVCGTSGHRNAGSQEYFASQELPPVADVLANRLYEHGIQHLTISAQTGQEELLRSLLKQYRGLVSGLIISAGQHPSDEQAPFWSDVISGYWQDVTEEQLSTARLMLYIQDTQQQLTVGFKNPSTTAPAPDDYWHAQFLMPLITNAISHSPISLGSELDTLLNESLKTRINRARPPVLLIWEPGQSSPMTESPVDHMNTLSEQKTVRKLAPLVKQKIRSFLARVTIQQTTATSVTAAAN